MSRPSEVWNNASSGLYYIVCVEGCDGNPDARRYKTRRSAELAAATHDKSKRHRKTVEDNRDADDINGALYEEGLTEGAPWAEESHAYRAEHWPIDT